MKMRDLLESYTEKTYGIWEESDEILSSVKEECSQFINEFLKKGLYVYRGMEGVNYDELHLIPTQSYREVHGAVFESHELRGSFENFLRKSGVSRYRKSVSTIMFEPEHFDGIQIDSWFYFIPRNGYRYHYYDVGMDGGDINVGTSLFSSMMEFGDDITSFMITFSDLKEIMYNLDPQEKENVLSVHDESTLNKILDGVNDVHTILKDVFAIDSSSISDVEKFTHILDVFLRGFKLHDDSGELLDLLHEIGSILSRISKDQHLESVLVLKNSVVVNKSPDLGSEVVFTCNDYYAIPYSSEGMNFIKELCK